MGISRAPGRSMVAVEPDPGISASSPRPRTFLCMFQYLPRQLAIALSARTVWIVEHDRLPERWRLAELHIAGDDASIHTVREELSSLIRHLLREIQASIEHREQDSLDP